MELGIGLFGLGTVGTGVVKILQQNAHQITERTGANLVVRHAVVHNLNKQRTGFVQDFPITDQPSDILNNPDIQIVVEVMGGISESYDIIKQAITAKKHVVTANKDLIASHGQELANLANENGVDLYYEAAVAGGIPILRTLATSFTADEITRVAGIINGTSNFILTQMASNGLTYENALALAQEKGFAEADPTNDVAGFDAAYKLIILSNFAFGVQPVLGDVSISGITNLTDLDIEDAQSFGYGIKLLGVAQRVGDSNNAISIEVAPHLVPFDHPLATVHNENNAVLVNGESVGEVMLYGPGAGEMPTANSVLSDLTNVATNYTPGKPFNTFNQNLDLAKPSQRVARRFVVVDVADTPGAMYSVTGMFTSAKISFTDLKQTPAKNGYARLVALTYPASDAQLNVIKTTIRNADGINLVSEYKIFS
ncbi:homoserine dehydrogenase [Leuconostoc pseudomesenteroides]|uniref:homoserine dehydrogenase n=1 Tax=Leuconostoc TaxID=1243 RepID=UPI0011DD172E|nr:MULTISPECIES: homoserine dehydrogenase [Leuconostoc]MBK0039994.1 homoserine dehydrogenase [Leuconostoc sp. S51]MBK0050953.1 homoserine dehydrogenase [Leuconostoc sp. S50]MBS0956888.1 homoserine dehydrogenase [Leuconostoc pseudomesenteroides]MCT4381380.1 homoserine dehydrogenase [Leuconostoc pseudomesenteroides]MCT4412561.1 homoserine dehydrogenase [Leuconostoc pseudomesenteroides]